MPPNPYAEPTLHLGRSGLGPEPTVTISTRAAFEAINQMFGGDAAAAAATAPAEEQRQRQQPEAGFRVPAPRPPRARPLAAAPSAPAASPGGSPGGFMIREDTQFVSVPLETIETEAAPAQGQAAAAVLSPVDGFGGGFCIREDTQFVTVPAGVAGDDDEEAGDAPGSPAAAAGRASPAGGFDGGGFCIREDTQYITVAVQDRGQATQEADAEEHEQQCGQAAAGVQADAAAAPEAAAGGFCIREDTMFVGPGSGASDGRQGAGAVSVSPSWSSEAGGSTGDLLGAQLAGVANADGTPTHSGSEAQVRPTACMLCSGSAERPLSSLQALVLGRLCMNVSRVTCICVSCVSCPSCQNYLLAHAQVSKWGFAPGADDTLALQLDAAGDGDTQALLDAVHAGPASPAGVPLAAGHPEDADAGATWLQSASRPSPALRGGAQGSPFTDALALQLGLQGLQLADVKENLPAGGCAWGAVGGTGCRLGDPAVAAAVLQPLGEARAAQLGAVVEADAEAEAALAEAGTAGGAELVRQDSFQVWEDDGDSQQQSGSTPISALAEQQVAAAAAAAAAEGDEAGYVTPLTAQPPALVDPFSPTFHARMLGCLEPAVPQARRSRGMLPAAWRSVTCRSCKKCTAGSTKCAHCCSAHADVLMLPCLRSGRGSTV